MREIEAKTIIQRVKPDMKSWFYADYNMNLYKGCTHGCIYCDSRSDCYQIPNFDEMNVKKNAIQILQRELQTKRLKGVVGMGSMSDPYNPYEKPLELTRQALKMILSYGYGVSIITKSNLLLRDLDLLEKINQQQSVHVGVTITAVEENLQKKIEQNVSTSLERFEMIQKLSQRGVFAGILMMPVLPFINDTYENIDQMILMAKKYEAKYIYPFFGVTIRDGQREYFYHQLDLHFPGLRQKYEETYGLNYVCYAPKGQELYHYFETQCKANGLLYHMEDINQAFYKAKQETQIQFDF